MNISDRSKFDILVVTGPTACGKTALAVTLAQQLDGEIISADSRQVYRRMDIGTGKDLSDYVVDGKKTPYHLIDILEPGEKYNVFEFQRDFREVYLDVKSRGKLPIVCGGSGMYLDSVVSGYDMFAVPPNPELRESLEEKSLDELISILSSYKELHNTTDVDSKKRAIRAIEIADYQSHVGVDERSFPKLNSLVIGISIDREERRAKISKRLRDRLDEGMVDEIKALLDEGIPPENLIYYGLEYKYVTNYLIGKLTYDDMVKELEIAIHQFAKRQMTWFRGMEKHGTKINWIDSKLSIEKKLFLIESVWETTCIRTS